MGTLGKILGRALIAAGGAGLLCLSLPAPVQADGSCEECWEVKDAGSEEYHLACRHSFSNGCADGPGWCIDWNPDCVS